MNWLARLKKTGTRPEVVPTKPTKAITPTFDEPTEPTKGGFVGFAGGLSGAFENSGPAANDQAPAPAFDREAFEERAGIVEHDGGMSRSQAEAMAADICGEPLDPDRHCWPHTEAMNTREIDLFMQRVDWFARRGVNPVKAERLADKLVQRDRDGDDRSMCLECAGLVSKGRCTPAQRGRIEGVHGLLEPVQHVLHRCEGFKGVQP